jgi:hypothetical protein
VLVAAALAAAAALLAGCPKDSSSTPSSSPASGGAAASSSSGLSGTYSGTVGNETMTIEFKPGNKLHMTLQTPDRMEEMDGEYAVDGNSVTIHAGEGMPMTFTLMGDALVSPLGPKLMKK